MGTKASWEERPKAGAEVALPPPVDAVIARARELTRMEIAALDRAERERSDSLLTAWRVLRSRMGSEPYASMRFAAEQRAWEAVQAALSGVGMPTPENDDYWRADIRPGAGAARAVRFAAAALVAPHLVDQELLDLLLLPWRTAIGDRDAG